MDVGQAHHASHEARQLACKLEYLQGESCLRWCWTLRHHVRGNSAVHGAEDVTSQQILRRSQEGTQGYSDEHQIR